MDANQSAHSRSSPMRGAPRRSSGFAMPNRSRTSGVQRGAWAAENRKSAAMPGHSPRPSRRATSTFSRTRSTVRPVVSSRTAIPGWASWNAPSRGASHCEARLCRVVIASSPWPVSVRSARAVRSRLMASDAARASRSPAGVSATSRGRRRNSDWPRRRSSAFTCQLTAAWLTPSSSAARVKLPRRP